MGRQHYRGALRRLRCRAVAEVSASARPLRTLPSQILIGLLGTTLLQGMAIPDAAPLLYSSPASVHSAPSRLLEVFLSYVR